MVQIVGLAGAGGVTKGQGVVANAAVERVAHVHADVHQEQVVAGARIERVVAQTAINRVVAVPKQHRDAAIERRGIEADAVTRAQHGAVHRHRGGVLVKRAAIANDVHIIGTGRQLDGLELGDIVQVGGGVVIGEHQLVKVGTALEGIGHRHLIPTVENVVLAAHQHAVTAAKERHIVAAGQAQGVLARAGLHRVVARARQQHGVVAVVGVDAVVASPVDDGVLASPGQDRDGPRQGADIQAQGFRRLQGIGVNHHPRAVVVKARVVRNRVAEGAVVTTQQLNRLDLEHIVQIGCALIVGDGQAIGLRTAVNGVVGAEVALRHDQVGIGAGIHRVAARAAQNDRVGTSACDDAVVARPAHHAVGTVFRRDGVVARTTIDGVVAREIRGANQTIGRQEQQLAASLEVGGVDLHGVAHVDRGGHPHGPAVGAPQVRGGRHAIVQRQDKAARILPKGHDFQIRDVVGALCQVIDPVIAQVTGQGRGVNNDAQGIDAISAVDRLGPGSFDHFRGPRHGKGVVVVLAIQGVHGATARDEVLADDGVVGHAAQNAVHAAGAVQGIVAQAADDGVLAIETRHGETVGLFVQIDQHAHRLPGGGDQGAVGAVVGTWRTTANAHNLAPRDRGGPAGGPTAVAQGVAAQALFNRQVVHPVGHIAAAVDDGDVVDGPAHDRGHQARAQRRFDADVLDVDDLVVVGLVQVRRGRLQHQGVQAGAAVDAGARVVAICDHLPRVGSGLDDHLAITVHIVVERGVVEHPLIQVLEGVVQAE